MGPQSDRDRRRAALRWATLLSPLAIPWVVVRTTDTTLVFPWGMVSLEGAHVVTLPAYLERTAGLPRHLRMWPLGVACYALATVWAGGGRRGADRRVTAGLFVLVAIATTWLASGLGVGFARTAVPVGSVHAVALAVWVWTRDAEGGGGGDDAGRERG